MLFHADKNVKDSMFNIYRNDIKERQQRKDNSVTKEKIEDKNFVDRIKKLNEDEMVRRSIEKLRKKNENMYSYNELWKGKDEERKNRYNRIFDPKINFPSLDPELINQSKPILLKGKSYDFNSKINFDSQRDHVNNIMNPDYLGIRNLYSLERNHKQEYQKMYRNFLDSQINTKFDLYDLNNHNLKDKEYHAMKRIEEEVLVKQNPCNIFKLIVIASYTFFIWNFLFEQNITASLSCINNLFDKIIIFCLFLNLFIQNRFG